MTTPTTERGRQVKAVLDMAASGWGLDVGDWDNDILAIEAEAAAPYRALFDLRWKADMRAIKRWQEAHPGNELVWPDHADMVEWMMDDRDALAALVAAQDALVAATLDDDFDPAEYMRLSLARDDALAAARKVVEEQK